ncbi:hypothetical protein GS4_32_00530 [Gordonia soli NBRC 108243]|uniref:Uncharacterized protein n=1 Tax=Gordonia soli NBRC 108243 TaxID=1223545 RepID=M0QNX2_9ACTN|nr:hypothetical protein GS4_32_00530 [Gordonia soli NBRC 108243]
MRAVLNSPIAGLAPWIVMSLFTGPGRFEEAVAGALGLALLVVFANWRLGNSVKLLEWFDTAFFLILAGIGLFASARVISWMELWGGEIANVALVAFALGSILIRRPFTLEYAKEATDPELWSSPIFIRTNYVITWAWVAAFGVSAIAGAIGDAVLDDAGNFWTGWIIQIGATVFAVSFTEFYPDYGPNKALAKMGVETDPPVSLVRLFDWIPAFVLIVGIMGLVTDSVSSTVGWVLVAVGAVAIGVMHRLFPAEKKAVADAVADAPRGQETPGAAQPPSTP